MSSKIEWLAKPGYRPEVWNVVDGCTHKSRGCDRCWAKRQAGRQMGPWRGRAFSDVRGHEDRLAVPLHWRAPRMVFVPSMGDLFHDEVPDEFIGRTFDVMWKCPQHRFLTLTKRKRIVKWVKEHASDLEFNWGDRINHPPMSCGDPFIIYNNELRDNCGWCYREDREKDDNCQHPSREDAYCDAKACPIGYPIAGKKELLELGYAEGDFYWTRDSNGEEYAEDPGIIRLHSRPLNAFCSNIWLGVSAEDQPTFNERVDWLHELRCIAPHAVLFMSLEPLLGPIDVSAAFERVEFSPLAGSSAPASKAVCDWVITGGESGPGARACNVEWIRSIVGQCGAAGVACFVKQLGANPRDRVCNITDWPDWRNRCHQIGDEGSESEMRIALTDPKGGDMDEWPADLRIRQWPEVSHVPA
jgi:protein gp37